MTSLYDDLLSEMRGLFAGERDAIANAANCAAAIFHGLPGLNWAGFYFKRSDGLLLGPFQGRPACVRIPFGRGVCGRAADLRRTVIVPDVAAFADHIACDPSSRSEIVIPLLRDGDLLGVLDVDSPSTGRFTQDDAEGLQAAAALWVSASDLTGTVAA